MPLGELRSLIYVALTRSANSDGRLMCRFYALDFRQPSSHDDGAREWLLILALVPLVYEFPVLVPLP